MGEANSSQGLAPHTPRRRLSRLLFLCLGLPHLRSPTGSALPGWCPELAGLGQMLALLQLLLPDVASHQGVTVLIHAMPEVLAGHRKKYSR